MLTSPHYSNEDEYTILAKKQFNTLSIEPPNGRTILPLSPHTPTLLSCRTQASSNLPLILYS